MNNGMYNSYGYPSYSQSGLYNQNGFINPNMYSQNNYSNYNSQQNQNSTNTNKIFVNGLEDARNRSLPPNSDYLFLDNDKNILYQKIVDGKGQFEVKTFNIVPAENKEEKNKLDDYVKKEELNGIKQKIQEIQENLKKISNPTPKPVDVLKKETI